MSLEHVRWECKPDCTGGNCCELFACKVCRAIEGSLTTHCPGVPVEEEHQQLVYKSTLDFEGDQWVRRDYQHHEIPRPSMHPVIDSVIEELNQGRKEEPMKNIGPVGQYPQLAQIYQAIASRQPTWNFRGLALPTKIFKGKDLYYVDHEGRRYVEQNPNSGTEYADRARAGVCIVWVIRLSDNCYLGRIEAGVVYMRGTLGAA